MILSDDCVARVQGSSAAAPTCTWLSSTTVRIGLTALTALQTGDELNLRPGVIHPFQIGTTRLADCAGPPPDNGDKCASGGALLQPPLRPVTPIARLAAQPVLSVCDDLDLGAQLSSGGGIYPLSYSYSVAVATSNPHETREEALAALPALEAVLYAAGPTVCTTATSNATSNASSSNATTATTVCTEVVSRSVRIATSLLPVQTAYTFTLVVQNRMGGISLPATRAVTKSTGPVLSVSFEGGEAERSTPRTRHTRGRLRRCWSRRTPARSRAAALD